jgi:threonyl-tRNA synthetase
VRGFTQDDGHVFCTEAQVEEEVRAFHAQALEVYRVFGMAGADNENVQIKIALRPESRLGAEYVDEHSQKRHPVMLHRAIVGSMERFIGILIEHHAGQLPAWLAPVQAVVMNITDAQADYVEEARKSLANQGLRVTADLRNEKIGYKIREHTLQRVPYLLVAGDRERDNGLLSVRTRGGEDLGTMSVADFCARLRGEQAA